jgi:hypothetical protein
MALQEEIMSKQVPEGLSRDRQIAELMETLLGHNVYGMFRGRDCHSLVDVAEVVLERSGSPSDFCRNWDDLTAKFRVLGNILATLKREGKTEAYEALKESLTDVTYVFPGETIPVEKTVPVTLVMFEPARMLAMLQWILRAKCQGLESHIGRPADSYLRPQLAEAMFKAFPSLAEAVQIRIQLNPYPGIEFGLACQVDVLRNFNIPDSFKPLYLTWGQFSDRIELGPSWATTPMIETEKWGKVHCASMFAFWAPGSQKEVLSLFSRQEQGHIATWQFQVHPKLLRADDDLMEFGLHDESDHSVWRHESSHRASLGVSQGLGAYIDPPRSYAVFEKGVQKADVFRVTLRGYKKR